MSPPRLELSLDAPSVIFSQSIPLRLAFVNDDRARPFPLDPSAFDVTTFVLLENGEAVAEGAGVERDLRAGFDQPLDNASTIAATEIPAGETARWSDDLLLYLDVPRPGAYEVEARFRFHESEAVSARVPLHVTPIDCAALDLVRDRACTDVVHLLTEDAGEPCALFEFRSIHAPRQRWSGVRIDRPPATRGCIARTDFTTLTSFAHDYMRWIAWWEEGTLTLVRVASDGVVRVSHPVDGSGVFGRPVQHEDGGVTVFLRRGPAELASIRCDAAGEVLAQRTIALPPGATRVLATEVVPGGSLAWLTTAPLTLHQLDGDTLRSNVILGDDVERGEILAASLDAKPLQRAAPPRIAAGGVLRRPRSSIVWTACAEWLARNASAAPWQYAEWELSEELLPPSESLLHMCVLAETDRATAAIVTSTGRAIYLPVAARPHPLPPLEPGLAREARLLHATTGIEWLTASRRGGATVTLVERAGGVGR